MADNVAITAGSGTTVATDDLAGVHYQRVKIVWGPDGTANDADVATGKPIPVQLRGSDGSDVSLSEDVAHDAVDSGKPVKIGAKAIAGLSTATLVAEADRTDLYAGLDGGLIVHPHGGLSDFHSGVATCTTGGNTSVISALGAGIKFYMTGGFIRNSGGTAGGGVLITDGSGGTTKADIPYTTLGAVFKCDPIAFTANTAVFADPTGTDTVVVTLFGFKSKV